MQFQMLAQTIASWTFKFTMLNVNHYQLELEYVLTKVLFVYV